MCVCAGVSSRRVSDSPQVSRSCFCGECCLQDERLSSLTLFTGAPNHQCGSLVLQAGISMGLREQQVDLYDAGNQGNRKNTADVILNHLTKVSSSWYTQYRLNKASISIAVLYCATRWCANSISDPTIILLHVVSC